jgi:hypothetical protein
MKHIFKFFALAIFCAFCNFSFGQTIAVDANLPINETWKPLEETNLVKVNYKITECNVPKDGLYANYVFLQFENKTNKTIEVSWDPELYYNGICATCDLTGLEKRHTIKLNSGEKLTSNCDYTDDLARKLQLFIKWNMVKNKRTLSSFAIQNIEIKTTH